MRAFTCSASLIEAANGRDDKWQRLRRRANARVASDAVRYFRIATAIITGNRAAGLSDRRQQLRRADFPGNLSQRFSDVDPRRNGHGKFALILDTCLPALGDALASYRLNA